MHDHTHEHTHAHAAAASKEETLALLRYMLHHNRHHAEELHELAHNVPDGEAHTLLHRAVDQLNESSDSLERALALLEEG